MTMWVWKIRTAGFAPVAFAFCMALATAQSASATSSSAFGVQASFTWKHVKTGVGPIGTISGSAPPAYAKSISIGPFQQIVPLLPNDGTNAAPVPTLTVSGQAIKANV